ncbi:glutathione S-transferase family protein [Mesorhizobium sp. BR1-1-2]|uniref:glutathione S-transferase family protein n=1 Tax=Mesorhizobium sp. BR1-1-2 TaxID=2876652 RepID=UPI001CCF2277|nr:glutathione S-transferase [Mesorhizobium sp. BR1-1-2]MBZ9964655.1 glutathione S-transferase [Mesorhizobium sp. BR1-1-2]
MKLYYSHRSPYVRLVMVAIHWAGLAQRIELMNTVVDIYRPLPDLMRDNPLAKIPTLVLDDASAIYDSRVICEYLDGCHQGPRLFPERGKARVEALRRLALGHGTIDLLLVWFTERNRPGALKSPEFVAALETKHQNVLDRMNEEVPDLIATPFSIGHAAIGTALSYSDFRFGTLDWRTGRQALAEWHDDFLKIPAVAADPFFDDLAAAAARELKSTASR